MVDKKPVGAHYGLRDWVAQRATAAIMALAVLVLTVALVVCRPGNFSEWQEFIFTGWVRLLLFMTILSVVWHAFIGARDIYMDYLKNDVLRLLKTIGMAVYLITCLVWAAWILFGLGN